MLQRRRLPDDEGLCLWWSGRWWHCWSGGPLGVSVYAPVTVENPSSGTQQQNNGEALGRAYQQVINKSVHEGIAKAIQPGGLIWNATKGR